MIRQILLPFPATVVKEINALQPDLEEGAAALEDAYNKAADAAIAGGDVETARREYQNQADAYAELLGKVVELEQSALPLLKDIKAPTLVAAGDSDLFSTPETTQQLVQGIEGARLYLCRNGGHVHHWEALEQFNDATLSFLLNHREGGGN